MNSRRVSFLSGIVLLRPRIVFSVTALFVCLFLVPAPPITGMSRYIDHTASMQPTAAHVDRSSTSLAGLSLLDGFEMIGQTGGASFALAVQGSYAYLGFGLRLVVLDITNPLHPNPIGRSEILSGETRSIDVQGGYAYVLDREGSLHILDVANAALPLEVGYYPVGKANDLAVMGTHAYVATEDGLLILNITNPANPTLDGYYGGTVVNSLSVSGSYAYIATGWGGLQIINIANPSGPTKVGSFNTGYAYGVDVAGDFAYVADGLGADLQIIDITTPSTPTLKGIFEVPNSWGSDVVVNGNYAYVVDGNKTLRIVDVSDPENPSEEGVYAGRVESIVFINDLAYCAAFHGLDVLDVSVPGNIEIIGQYSTRLSLPRDMVVDGSYAYVLDAPSVFDHRFGGDGLRILDVSDLGVITQIASYDTPSLPQNIEVDSDYAYIGHSDFVRVSAPGFEIIDISDPTSPTLAWSPPSQDNWYVTGVAIREESPSARYAYVFGNGLRILDVTDPRDPVVLYSGGPNYIGGAVSGEYAYLLGASGLDIVRTTPVTEPTVIGHFDTNGASVIAVAGLYAYLGCQGGLIIIDISDPANPRGIGTFQLPVNVDFVAKLAIQGNYIYLQSDHSVCLVDVSVPTDPVLVGYYAVGGAGLALADEYVFLTGGTEYFPTGTQGLVVLRRTATYSISGRVVDNLSQPLAGVSFSAGAAGSATTDAVGYYTVTGVVSGTYTITPTKGGYTFTPASRVVTVPPDGTGQDFTGNIAKKTPVIIIPGIMGSRLFNSPTGQEQQVWADPQKVFWSRFPGNPELSPLMVLRLGPDGSSPLFPGDVQYSTVTTKPGIEGLITRITGEVSIVGFPLKQLDEPVYSTIIHHFTNTLSYTLGVDLFVYPYDWRKSIALTVETLDSLVQSVTLPGGPSQVILVAHSMGGLVVRQYISSHAAKVKQAVILGTPFLGTPGAFDGLLGGTCNEVEVPKMGTICAPAKSVVKALVPNYASFYQLMPSEAYFTLNEGGFVGEGTYFDASGSCPQCLSYADTYVTSIAENLNPTLAANAHQFHDALDTSGWNGVQVDLVGGIGEPTVAGILLAQRWSWTTMGMKVVGVPVTRLSGDGTVTELSASLNGPGGNLRGSATYARFFSEHGALVKDPAVLSYMDVKLGLSAAPLSSIESEPLTDVIGVQIVAFGVQAVDVYDEANRYTGPLSGTEFIEQSIPGSAYFTDQDMTTVALEGGYFYTITVIPTGLGSVDVTLIRSTLTATLTSTLFVGISATAQTRLSLTGDPYIVDTWIVDPEGTGVGIAPVTPTVVYTSGTEIDVTPPTTTITLEGVRDIWAWFNSLVTVTLTASDGITGSGISRIEYGFSRQAGVYIYTGPFVVQPEDVGVLSALAVDLAGNAQCPATQERLAPERVYLPMARK